MVAGLSTLDAIESKLDRLLSKVKQVDGLLGRAGSAGQSGVGMGKFSTTAQGSGGNNVMSGSLASVPGFSAISTGTSQMLTGLGRMAGGLGTAAAGVAMMMPDVGATLTRESGYFGAGVASGAMVGRAQLQGQTRLGLGQFATSAGSDAAVAAILASRGVVPGSADYLRTVSGVAGAARYLNMPNEVAAASMANTTMGQSSAAFMRSFGIFTANPQTGEKLSEAQIFEQVYQRATAGRPSANVAETMDSLNRGFLGETIRNMDMLDDAGKARMSQYFIDKASGLTVDLANPGSLDQAVRRNTEQGYENPFLAAYKLSSKETENMEAATQPYISGVKEATNALIDLKDFTRTELIPTFGALNAGIQTFLGNTTGAGTVGAVTGSVGALGGAGMALGGAGILAGGLSMFAKGGGMTALSGVAKAGASALGSAAARVLPVAAPVVAGAAGFSRGASNDGFSIGQMLLSMGGSAVAGAVLGGGVPGAIIGGLVGGVSYAGGHMLGRMVGGEGGSGATGTSGATSGRSLSDTMGGGGGGFKLQRPVPGPLRARFNQKYSSFDSNKLVWPDGHRGVDFDANAGQPVIAAAEGRATAHTSEGFGVFIKIRHENGMYTYYAHLSRAAVSDKYVRAGEVIGYVGSTGRSSAPHLHFALSKTDSTNHPHVVDPVPYLAGGAGYASGVQATNQNAATTSLSQSSGVSVSAPQSDFSQLSSSTAASSGSLATSVAGVGTASAGTFSPVAPYSASSYYRGEGGAGAVIGSRGNSVTINLSIAKASDDEARRFASWLKDYLEEEQLTDRMGAN
jgi:hypothetical protein